MEELNVTITPNDKGEIIIRTGDAAPQTPKSPVKLSGTIESVLDFAAKRKEEFSKVKAHVIINRKAGTVQLVTSEDEHLKYEVSGKMILHEYIEQLQINKGKTWTLTDLISLFKLNRRFFITRDEHATMVNALTQFQARTEVEFENANDFKGSVAQKKITKVKHDVPLQFTMKIPVFEGQAEKQFKVDIEVLPENGSIVCSFISVELAELIDESKEELFTTVKNSLSDYVQIVQ